MNTIQLFAWADRHFREIRLILAPLFVLMVAGVYALVYYTGGIKFVYSHSMYLPILLSGIVFGIRGGVFIGALGGFALGPLMPIDVVTGEMQNTANWLYRSGFFVLIGLLSGLASDRARDYIEHLKWVSRHDPSTGLPNRSALFERLAEMRKADNQLRQPMLVVVSVENMMELKAALGFGVIRETISQLADRFSTSQPGCTVYRTETALLGILLDAGDQSAEDLAGELVATARRPIRLDAIPIHIDSRMGAVTFNGDSHTPEEYLQHAEAALIIAQKKGQDFVTYQPAIVSFTEENLAILGSLNRAIDDGQISLDYQPKVYLASGLVHGAEALIRWNHPVRGPLPPEAFMPRVEQSTLVQVITEFALEQAIAQMADWRKRGIKIPIAVNISTRNLLQPRFAEQVAGLLNHYRLSGESLELEITEGALMMDMERTIEELLRMTELNIIISIDDFGTGYSSLQYLHRLPISLIKIDQSFVRRLPDDNGAVSIVKAAVTLAHQMGIKVIAEGVENPVIYRFLKEIGCDLAQGFLLSRPLPPEAFAAWYHQCGGTFTVPEP
jgi:EAL domain-containing protein (putative c-di-GMP-specific phosphodiesterase class I)/GGDEF domain-containing protein